MAKAMKYFDEYVHLCEETEYNLKKRMNSRKEKKPTNEVLSVLVCQELLEISRQIKGHKTDSRVDKNLPTV
jgi:hypothetical protein